MGKLEAVAAEFRKASHAQMSATTQRTIRENVNVTAQVMQLSEKAAELSYDNDNLQVSCYFLKCQNNCITFISNLVKYKLAMMKLKKSYMF